MQSIHHLRRLLAERIKNTDHGLQSSVNCQIQMRILRRKRIHSVLFRRIHAALLVLKDKMIASDHRTLAADLAGNAVRHHIFYLCMHLLMPDAALLCFRHHRIRNGMRKMLFQAGCDLQCLFLTLAVEGFNMNHRRCRMRQSSCFVENNRIRLCHSLQKLAALDGNVIGSRLTDCGQNRKRHGELQCAGKIYHQRSHCPRDISRQEIDEHRQSERIRNQRIRQVKGPRLRGGFQLLRLLDHVDDLVVFSRAGLLRDLDDALTFLDHGSGIDIAALRLHNRHRFSGHGSLVDAHLAFHNNTVQRNHIRRTDADAVADLHILDGNQHILPVRGLHPYFVDLQGHGPCKIPDGFLVRPLFQQISDVQKPHDGRGRVKISHQHGCRNGRGIQHRNLKFSLKKTLNSSCNKFYAPERGPGDLNRQRQKKLPKIPSRDGHRELFLILMIEGPSGFLRNKRDGRRILVRKSTESLQELPPVLFCFLIGDARIPRLIVYLRILHKSKALQVILQDIRLIHRHTIPTHVNAHGVSRFMTNYIFHILSAPYLFCLLFFLPGFLLRLVLRDEGLCVLDRLLLILGIALLIDICGIRPDVLAVLL